MEIYLVLGVLFTAVILFISERFSIDIVALIVLALLIVLGLVTPSEATKGFSNPATVTVAAMFVLSAAMERTGCLLWAGRLLMKIGNRPTWLLITIATVVGVGSAFVNNTALVAVFLPIVVVTATKYKITPSKYLIPMSFASQAGGVCTLIGTSTNLIVSSFAESQGIGAFSMFEMGRLGVILFITLIAYFIFLGRFLLPVRKGEQLTQAYQLGTYFSELRLTDKSSMVGETLSHTKLGKRHDIKIVKVIRNSRVLANHRRVKLQPGDILLVQGKVDDLIRLKDFEGLELEPEKLLRDKEFAATEKTVAEALLPLNSHFIGKTLEKIGFYEKFKLVVLALQRRGKITYKSLRKISLKLGDTLLIRGAKEEIDKLRHNKNLIVLEEISDLPAAKEKAPYAILIVSGVILLATFNVMPIVMSAIIGCVLVVISGCLTVDEAYEAINWQVIFLLAGIIPLGIAMETSGAANWLVHLGVEGLASWGPYVILAALYLFATLLTEAMSNNAAAILLAPIAVSIAASLNVHPKPFLMAVAFAASTSFLTPVGYQTNAMVCGPGGYKYTDFIKVGLPLNVIFLIISSLLIPYFWPF